MERLKFDPALLCQAILDRGLTAQGLADAVGCTLGTVYFWCRGLSRPKRKWAARIAEVLGSTPEALGLVPTVHPLLQALAECEMSQTALARQLGVSATVVHYWSLGRQRPSIRRAQEIASLLGKTPSELGWNPKTRKIPLFVRRRVIISRNDTVFCVTISRRLLHVFKDRLPAENMARVLREQFLEVEIVEKLIL